MKLKDRPAYPFEGGQNNVMQPCTGMSMREHFAGLAMQGLMAGITDETEWNLDEYATTSIEMAEALLDRLEERS